MAGTLVSAKMVALRKKILCRLFVDFSCGLCQHPALPGFSFQPGEPDWAFSQSHHDPPGFDSHSVGIDRAHPGVGVSGGGMAFVFSAAFFARMFPDPSTVFRNLSLRIGLRVIAAPLVDATIRLCSCGRNLAGTAKTSPSKGNLAKISAGYFNEGESNLRLIGRFGVNDLAKACRTTLGTIKGFHSGCRSGRIDLH